VTDAIAPYFRKHPRNCVRRASGLVLTRYSENPRSGDAGGQGGSVKNKGC